MSDLPEHRSSPAGIPQFPVCHARGGTSTGLILAREALPEDEALVEELLRHLMGVPLQGEWPGNSQITGLGRGGPTSNKVFIVERRPGESRMISTLAQMAAGKSAIDWSVNCGNMSAALPLYAWQRGWLTPEGDSGQIEIYNSNTRTTLYARLGFAHGQLLSDTRIPGVNGVFPGVDLFLQDPVGAKTGALFPTGQAQDVLDGIAATCIDVAVPMVIVLAADLGKSGEETPAQLDADPQFKARLLELMVLGGLRMGLRRRDGSLMSADDLRRSETIPKICMVSPAREGGDIATRYFTPQNAHPSLAVSGGCCLAAACLAPGTVAQRMLAEVPRLGATLGEHRVAIENPAGVLQTLVKARLEGAQLLIEGAAYRRSAQILLQGHTPLYNASPELIAALGSL
ncbi:PrpF domain-containing protein [Pseudomonas sp. PH1b]|uniref:PrpF domain-containing protein n=1 Tax=Pseudomonas sp. PH1b TaxID=1397282 RepID=UPI0004681496|nr:PrpF domain-containing protein [Pseudomonas sp. PH1b]